MRVGMLFLLMGCSGQHAPGPGGGGVGADDSAAGRDTDSGDPDERAGRTCVDGRTDLGAGAPEVYAHQLAGDYVVVEVESEVFDPFFVMVSYPGDGTQAYEDGAPVVVTVQPSLDLTPMWNLDPKGYFPPEYGMVEVQAVMPGWSVRDRSTAGELDFGGDASAAAVVEAMRFATGRATTVEGWTIDQLVAQPVCTAPIAMMATSSGGITGTRALELAEAELIADVLGFAGYENPSFPMVTVLDLGSVWMDPDRETDGDGNGASWDDGRNHHVDTDTCDVSACEADWSTLAWDADINGAEVFADTPNMWSEDGLFYLDVNGNGALDLDPDLGLDVDGSGAIEIDEDYVFFPHEDPTRDPARTTWSRELTAAASELGLFETWPETVSTAEESAAFWDERQLASRVAAVSENLGPDAQISMVFTAVPHGAAHGDRPQLTVLYDAWLATDTTVRLNPSLDVAACVAKGDELDGWGGGLPPDTPLDRDALPNLALPEDVGAERVRYLATLQLFWDAWGPPIDCPGG